MIPFVFMQLTLSLYGQTTRYVAITGNDHEGVSTCAIPGEPCRTIAHAIEISFDGDTLRIAGGIYTESITIDKSLSLSGAGQGVTIIQASSVPPGTPGEASNRVITLNEGLEVEIVNVTIRHGNSLGGFPESAGGGLFNIGGMLTLTNVTFSDNLAAGYGGGMYNERSSPLLTNVTFRDNRVLFGYGGGLYNLDGSPILNDIVFIGNSVHIDGGGMYNFGIVSPILHNVIFEKNEAERGGGMFNREFSQAMLTSVTFINNTSTGIKAEHDGGGGMFNEHNTVTLNNVSFTGNQAVRGGGMRNNASDPRLTNVYFHENEAGYGGGMYNYDNSAPSLLNVVFSGNRVEHNGGGILNSNSSPSLANIAFYGNSADESGGGLYNFDNSVPKLVNVTLSGNTAGFDGGGIRNHNSTTTLINTIVWGNQAAGNGNEIADNAGSTTELIYSLFGNDDGDVVQGGGFHADQNSLTVDPFFIDAASGDLRLQSASPAIDAGDPDTDPSLFHRTAGEMPVDLGGNPRINNGRIDMGAYEFFDPLTSVKESTALPGTMVLHPNYPNPFNPSTVISYTLPEPSQVELVVFDMMGRRIEVLSDGFQQAGRHDMRFDAGNLASGVYVYRLRVHNPDAGMNEMKVHTGKMILLR